MVAHPDIVRAAEYMVAAHGKDAWLKATARANDLLARGQSDASALWRLIAAELAKQQQVGHQAGRDH